MFKKRKIISLSIAFVFLLSFLFSGCSKKQSETSNQNSNNSEPVELIWYTIGTPQKDMEKVNEKINEYIKDKIGATVKIKQIDWETIAIRCRL